MRIVFVARKSLHALNLVSSLNVPGNLEPPFAAPIVTLLPKKLKLRFDCERKLEVPLILNSRLHIYFTNNFYYDDVDMITSIEMLFRCKVSCFGVLQGTEENLFGPDA